MFQSDGSDVVEPQPDIELADQMYPSYYVIQAFDSGGRLGASLLKLVIEKVKPLLRKK